jgi:uncharacterized membrane protein HdeD (DUF308 family)
MTSNARDPVAVVVAVDAATMRRNWGWFVALGIVQVIAGTLAVSFAFGATLALS